MKILWVKLGGLVPLDTGGKIRSYHIAKELAARNSVTFFTAYGAHEGDIHRQLESVFDRVVLCPLDLPEKLGTADKLNYARHIFSSKPYTLNNYCRPKAIDSLKQLLRSESFDLILADFLNAAGLIPRDVQIPTVIFTHNVEALIFKRHWEVTQNPIWKLMYRYEYRRTKRIEQKFLSAANHVLAVSDTDKEFFTQFLEQKMVSVIPTGVDTDFFQPMPSEQVEPNSLVFTGSMDWAPNEDGILYFAEKILPLIRAEIPDVKLSIVGRSPSAKIQALSQHNKGVVVTGRVDDIRPHIQLGSVYIVPLRIGSGTRLKIFEAMAMGKPIVSTSLGAEGLPVTNGNDIRLADEPETFARETIALLTNAGERERLGLAARNLVEERYSWASVAEHCNRVLGGVVAARAASTSK
jgi:sugar transferase (PEP-CTERM/EpsH1 system associated)